MKRTKISRPVAAVLCGIGLGVAVPDAASAVRSAPAASVAAPPVHCLSGVRRVQVTHRHTPPHRLYVVQDVWIPFMTSSSAPCLKNGGSASRS